MRVELIFKGPISLVTGSKLDIVLPEGAKVKNLISKLREMFLSKADEMGLGEVLHNFNGHNLILVNGVHISVLGGVEKVLDTNDRVHIVNFTHGG